ncbi:BolA protein [Macleaya cordata]|uniref:BolA protein n=1 Tax=Macleaya cordata TaxID=56857 RepID=A0A200Q3B2_MACCD|nr:BolA protein [Macleaya cordata]
MLLSRANRIKQKLQSALEASILEVEDVSYQHAGHAAVKDNANETHFNVKIVSSKFDGQSLVKRHRMVYDLLNDELQSGLHALSIVAKTPQETGRGYKGQGGVQMLLSAEQEAQQIVSSARSLKMARLKQAKEEAEREISHYRAHLEAEHQNNVSETSGNSGSNVKRLEEETDIKIQSLKDMSSRVSKDVVAMLMKQVMTVRT